MNEFWLITAPGEQTCQDTWDNLNRATSRESGLSLNFKFNLPDLKVGTLDQLVGLSDDLTKLDTYAESVTKKLVQYMSEVLKGTRDKLLENLLINGKDMTAYLTKFQWESAKYPVRQSLRSITDLISKQVTQIDNDLKAKANAYNNLQNNLASLERKATGNLLTKDLADVVKKEHFVLDSEYLVTLLVVVPRIMFKDWQQKYESLAPMVVPRSSELVCEDSDSGLFTVTLFRKVIDEYKLHCRENKFMVRDFVYDEKTLQAGKNERNKLTVESQKQFAPLVRWLQINFGEVFSAWTHVKALRAFVESVLRYGLPVNFQAMLLQPQKKNAKRLREVLNQLYAHLDTAGSANSGHIDMTDDMPGLVGLGQADYYPYVFFKINIDSLLEVSVKR